MSEKNNSKIDDENNNIYHLDTRKALSKHFFEKRENKFIYASFEREMTFYESVCSGNLEIVKTFFTPLGGEGFGKLSDDFLQNLKYHLVISIAIITRFCINAGMTLEEAYSMSDIYIQQTDRCTSREQIDDIHYRMIVEFTKRMRQIKSKHTYSKAVMLVLDYISDHLHEKISVKDIADFVSYSVPYISRLFHSEMGIPLSTYVIRKKVETAENLIQFSDYSFLEISNYLNFSSQSYFIKQFKKYTGITPKKYYYKYHLYEKENKNIEK